MEYTKLLAVIQEKSQQLFPELVATRRHLHQFPEIGREEKLTTQFLLEKIHPLNLKTAVTASKTGFWADLMNREHGKLLMLRTDIDALPINEQCQTEYISQNKGAMHACGHDAHATIMWGCAKILSEIREHLPGNVRFLFQPAEELTPGGAIDMMERGVMENVEAALALHVDPRLAVGRIAVKYGPAMASTDIFRMKIIGKGGHAASPDRTVDPITIAVQIVNAMNHIVSRNIQPTEPAVISVTRLAGGNTINVIPGEVEIWGTTRTFSRELQNALRQRIESTVMQICTIHGAEYDIDFQNGAPPVLNDSAITDLINTSASQILGADQVEIYERPDMGAEDFAWYLEHVPGAMFFLGTQGRGGTGYELHHPCFDIDEQALVVGVQTYCATVLKYFLK